MMDCKAPVSIYLCLYLPIQLACLALTLPERLDLMTCWEKDRDTRGREGEKEGRLREREKNEGREEEGTDER